MLILLTILHVIVCLFLIVVVLLQSGKGGDVASAFTGMGSQTAFGPRGTATIFSRLTAGAVVVFMLTSLSLSILTSRNSGGGSVLEGEKAQPTKSAPAPVPQQAPAQQQQQPAPAPQPK
jgi:preprotein translocase subunit SecG